MARNYSISLKGFGEQAIAANRKNVKAPKLIVIDDSATIPGRMNSK